QSQFSQEFQVSGQVARHKYVGGLYYFNEHVGEYDKYFLTIIDIPGFPSGIGLNNPGGSDYTGHHQSYAVYASDSWTPPILDDKLEFTGGVRFTIDRRRIAYLNTVPGVTLGTANHYRRDSAASGDATVKYQWTPDLMTYLRFANAYGSGGFSGRDDPT